MAPLPLPLSGIIPSSFWSSSQAPLESFSHLETTLPLLPHRSLLPVLLCPCFIISPRQQLLFLTVRLQIRRLCLTLEHRNHRLPASYGPGRTRPPIPIISVCPAVGRRRSYCELTSTSTIARTMISAPSTQPHVCPTRFTGQHQHRGLGLRCDFMASGSFNGTQLNAHQRGSASPRRIDQVSMRDRTREAGHWHHLILNAQLHSSCHSVN